MLTAEGFKVLAGKRVELITNPSGVNRKLDTTLDVLRAAPRVKRVALLSARWVWQWHGCDAAGFAKWEIGLGDRCGGGDGGGKFRAERKGFCWINPCLSSCALSMDA